MSGSLDPSDRENLPDWRESAKQDRWYEIEVYHLPVSELLELEAAIIAFLPERKRGDGVDSWIGPIPKHEARTHPEYHAAFLLQSVYRRLSLLKADRESPQSIDDPDYVGLFYNPLECAEQILCDVGINYQGWQKTYLYFSKKYDCWTQIDTELGDKFSKIRMDFDLYRASLIDESIDIQNKALEVYRKWINVAEWRNAQTLAQLNRFEEIFEPYTVEFHALKILQYFDSVLRDRSENSDEAGTLHIDSRVHDGKAIFYGEIGFLIGRHYEAISKKPYEPHAIRGMGTLSSSQAGAEARRAKFLDRSQATLREMKRLRDAGHSISRAAEIAATNGFGTSQGANRKLWNRRRPDKGD